MPGCLHFPRKGKEGIVGVLGASGTCSECVVGVVACVLGEGDTDLRCFFFFFFTKLQ